MKYLESQNILHRDLALRNLLVSGEEGNYIVKVSDFGLSRNIDDYYKSENINVPVKWTAPEVFEYGKFTVKCDVWSLGIVLWELFSYGAIPYPTMSNEKVFEKVKNDYRMPAPDNCPNEIYQIMLQCWNNDPQKRPTFQQLYEEIQKLSNNNTEPQKELVFTPVNSSSETYKLTE